MSPRTKEQVEKLREGKMQHIEEVALLLFAENGYKGTSISSIAKKAGISKGLLYNYYQSKEALLSKIMIHGITAMMELFDSDRDGVITNREMNDMIDKSFELMKNHGSFYRLYFSLMLQPGVFESVQDEFWKSAEPFQQMLLAYYQSQNSPDPIAEISLLYAILDGVGMHYLFRPHEFPVENVKMLIKKQFINKQPDHE